MSITILLFHVFFIVIAKIAFGDLREKLCGSNIALSVVVYVCLMLVCKAAIL